MKRCLPSVVGHIDRRARLEQESDRIDCVFLGLITAASIRVSRSDAGRCRQRCDAIRHGRVLIGALLEQPAHGVDVARLGRAHERRGADGEHVIAATIGRRTLRRAAIDLGG